MCRVLSYLGKPLLLENLIDKSSNSLITQSYDPKFMNDLKNNLSGCGFITWNQAKALKQEPLLYKTKNVPFYDYNFMRLIRNLYSDCTIAHIRGNGLNDKAIVIDNNAHPFLFPEASIALAHNGTLSGLNAIKPDLSQIIHPKYLHAIRGTTDSEWIYATLLSHLPSVKNRSYRATEVVNALQDTYQTIRRYRKKRQVTTPSPVNLFISNGQFIIIARFVYDFGNYTQALYSTQLYYHSLWYTYGDSYVEKETEYAMQPGKNTSVLFASEPLTTNTTGWLEVPEYSIISVERQAKQQLRMHIEDIPA